MYLLTNFLQYNLILSLLISRIKKHDELKEIYVEIKNICSIFIIIVKIKF
jgi:hypothetical protein